MSRAQILTLALLSMHYVLGLMCIALARGERSAPALRAWGWGLLAFATGALLTLINPLPLMLRQVSGNTIITVSAVLCSAALVHHTPWRFPRWSQVAVLVAALTGLLANHLGQHALHWDIGIPTYAAILMFGVGASRLWAGTAPAQRLAARFLVVFVALTMGVWLARYLAIYDVLQGGWERERADLVVALFAIGQLICLVAVTLGMIWLEVLLMRDRLERMALTDPLTGLPNRRAMRAQFEQEVARARRTGEGFALALFDADHFKALNDAHGHLAGDAVLAWVSTTLAATKRGADVLGRIGGEEFLVLLPGLTRMDAIAAAERLRTAVGETALEFEGRPLRATLSGGLALFPEEGEDWDRLFATADRRLYRAKQDGRDRLVADGL